jgi:hypothetical protein
MTPTWRKPAGALLILAYIAIWSVLVVSQAERIGWLPMPLQAVVYCIAGIVWIVPLKPLLRWMEIGRWRG